jgi:shikimate dehydrogenase
VKRSAISGHTRVFGLVGHPVRHSLSPAMYNALFDRFDIDAVYLAFDVHPDQANKVADLVRVMDLAGVNLTVPFKETLLPHLNSATAAAREAGAVNVVTQMDGTLMGYNTDGEGFVRSLAEEGGPDPSGIHAIVLGAGGAARAVASGLLDRGAERITFLNRTQSRAVSAAKALAHTYKQATVDVAKLSAEDFAAHATSARLVVNCTSGPAAEVVADFDPGALGPSASWVDINYWMDDPPCQRTVASAGHQFHNGLGMLAHQGALAFELFTGYPATGSELRAFLLERE